MHRKKNPGFSKVITGIKPSGIRKFFDLVLNTPDIVSLGVGEPDFPTPWRYSEHAIYQIERGVTSYTSNYGLMELREEVAAYLNRRFGTTYRPDETMITVGVSEGIDIVMRSILDPGDEVIIFEPCYVSYAPMVRLAGGVPVVVPLTARRKFHPDMGTIRDSVSSRTKAIFLNYPGNPTGASLSRNELEEIYAIAEEHNLYVISDEVYAEMTYDGEHYSVASIPDSHHRVILLSGLSKAWAMTGWRIGYICAAKEIIDMVVKIHQYSILCAPIMGQFAAIEALRSGDREKDEMIEEYRRRRDFIFNGFLDMGLNVHKPEGAFYIFPSIKKTGMSSEEFALSLLSEERVAVVPGSAFGNPGEGYIRCSFASSMDQIEVALARIKRFLRKRV